MGSTTVVPLGGLGEIGLNALVLDDGEDAIAIDCGLMFPRAGHLGIDYFIPDFTFLRERGSRLRAILLTHGHEDHVGAVPHLLGDVQVPVYGTRTTLAAVEGRFDGRLAVAKSLLNPVVAGGRVEFGRFRAHFLHVTHSVPEACAIAVETPGGNILHTGDFNFDPTPVDGRRTDEAGLVAWGERGVDLLCCDSTNAIVEGRTPSERSVGVALRRWLPQVEGRAYVTLFASNVHRIQQVIEVSRELRRRVAFLGRSVTESARAARRLGQLRVAPGDLVPAAHASRLPRAGLTVVLGGSQAEPGSALWRVARGREPAHSVVPGDALFHCARRIPGNEGGIHDLVERCAGQGASVFWGDVHGVHVSGHPASDDVGRMLRLVRPTHLLPVHGEFWHLDALAARAVMAGIPTARVHRSVNGQTLILSGGEVKLGGRVPAGRVIVDGGGEAAAGAAFLKERYRLARDGVLVVARPSHPGAAREVRVQLRGVLDGQRAAQVVRELAAELAESPPGGAGTPAAWERQVRRVVSRYFRAHGLRHPTVIVMAEEPEGGDVDSAASAPVQ